MHPSIVVPLKLFPVSLRVFPKSTYILQLWKEEKTRKKSAATITTRKIGGGINYFNCWKSEVKKENVRISTNSRAFNLSSSSSSSSGWKRLFFMPRQTPPVYREKSKAFKERKAEERGKKRRERENRSVDGYDDEKWITFRVWPTRFIAIRVYKR